MRIHTDNLTARDVHRAAFIANVAVIHLSAHGSKSRDHAFEVAISGSSPYQSAHASNDRGSGGHKAATWDEWGLFLVELFKSEPTVIAGPYKGFDDFIEQTNEAVEANLRYERIVGHKRPGHTGPWLNDSVVRELAGV